MPKITINVPAEVLESLRQAAKHNYRTLTAEIVQRCMAPVHTSMANIQQGMADVHTSMAIVQQSMAKSHTLQDVLEADNQDDLTVKARVLLSVWQELFPKQKMSEYSMSKLLDIAGGTAEFVYEQFALAASKDNLNNPYGYVKKVLAAEMEKKSKPKTVIVGGVLMRERTAQDDEDDEWAKNFLKERGEWDDDDAQWEPVSYGN